MKKPFMAGMLITLGSICWLLLPLGYWFIHGDYERYVWIISGPFPLSHLGSAPVQLAMDIGIGTIGAVLIAIGVIVLRYKQ